jgi:hypothetical protein
MGFGYYRHISNADMALLIGYLRSIPPIDKVGE